MSSFLIFSIEISLSDKEISINNILKDNNLDYNSELKDLNILFKKIENDN